MQNNVRRKIRIRDLIEFYDFLFLRVFNKGLT